MEEKKEAPGKDSETDWSFLNISNADPNQLYHVVETTVNGVTKKIMVPVMKEQSKQNISSSSVSSTETTISSGINETIPVTEPTCLSDDATDLKLQISDVTSLKPFINLPAPANVLDNKSLPTAKGCVRRRGRRPKKCQQDGTASRKVADILGKPAPRVRPSKRRKHPELSVQDGKIVIDITKPVTDPNVIKDIVYALTCGADLSKKAKSSFANVGHHNQDVQRVIRQHPKVPQNESKILIHVGQTAEGSHIYKSFDISTCASACKPGFTDSRQQPTGSETLTNSQALPGVNCYVRPSQSITNGAINATYHAGLQSVNNSASVVNALLPITPASTADVKVSHNNTISTKNLPAAVGQTQTGPIPGSCFQVTTASSLSHLQNSGSQQCVQIVETDTGQEKPLSKQNCSPSIQKNLNNNTVGFGTSTPVILAQDGQNLVLIDTDGKVVYLKCQQNIQPSVPHSQIRPNQAEPQTHNILVNSTDFKNPNAAGKQSALLNKCFKGSGCFIPASPVPSQPQIVQSVLSNAQTTANSNFQLPFAALNFPNNSSIPTGIIRPVKQVPQNQSSQSFVLPSPPVVATNIQLQSATGIVNPKIHLHNQSKNIGSLNNISATKQMPQNQSNGTVILQKGTAVFNNIIHPVLGQTSLTRNDVPKQSLEQSVLALTPSKIPFSPVSNTSVMGNGVSTPEQMQDYILEGKPVQIDDMDIGKLLTIARSGGQKTGTQEMHNSKRKSPVIKDYLSISPCSRGARLEHRKNGCRSSIARRQSDMNIGHERRIYPKPSDVMSDNHSAVELTLPSETEGNGTPKTSQIVNQESITESEGRTSVLGCSIVKLMKQDLALTDDSDNRRLESHPSSMMELLKPCKVVLEKLHLGKKTSVNLKRSKLLANVKQHVLNSGKPDVSRRGENMESSECSRKADVDLVHEKFKKSRKEQIKRNRRNTRRKSRH